MRKCGKTIEPRNWFNWFCGRIMFPMRESEQVGGGDEITTCHVVMAGGCALCIACSLQLPAPPHPPPGP